MLVGAIGVFQPVVDESLGDRLEDSKRVAPISDLEKRDGLFDEPLQFLHVTGGSIAVPIAAAALALGEQVAGVFADRLGIDGGPSPTGVRAAR